MRQLERIMKHVKDIIGLKQLLIILTNVRFIIFERLKSKSLSYVPFSCKVGKYVTISKECNINANVMIGDGTYIANNVVVNHCKKIGKYCSIASYVSIGLGSHPINWVSTSPVFYSKTRGLVKQTTFNYLNEKQPTEIGNDVWIGNNVQILSGVVIGNGAIIGAGSVVTKNIPPYAIAAGSPAKVIKYRFSKEQIEKLLKTEWWNHSFKVLEKNVEYMNDIDKFLQLY